MSTRIATVTTIVIDCDDDGCMLQYLATPGETYEQALQAAAALGWYTAGLADLCPTHAPKGPDIA